MTLDDLFKVNNSALGQGGAPSYDLNTPQGRQLLQMTLGAGNSGQMATGVEAFLSNKYTPNYASSSLSPESGGNLATNQLQNYSSLFNLGDALGYQGNRAGMNQVANYNNAYNPSSGGAGAIDPITGMGVGGNGRSANAADSNMQQYYSGLDDYLKNYSTISGMSSGWDGSKGNSRSAASTLYRNDGNNVLQPVSTPETYTARERGNWFQENPEFLSALSVMLPAFGGWAGLFGQAAGATGASMGAGVTGLGTTGTIAANAAGSALTGAAAGGTKGALTGLAGTLGGWAGGQAAGAGLGADYSKLGSQLGSQVGKTLAGQYLPNQPGINPGTNPWAGTQIAGNPTQAENANLAWNNMA